MTKIIFIEPNGNEKTIEAENGLSILEVAHNNGIDLEGACEGSLACSTCHIIVEKVSLIISQIRQMKKKTCLI